ncbi:MAG: O-antigen ligase family protein [Armatimonadetes bacterium]|nr:O-antigen ligase family protein [Armatimonadota bacterium]
MAEQTAVGFPAGLKAFQSGSKSVLYIAVAVLVTSLVLGWSVLLDNPAYGLLGLAGLAFALVCLADPFWGLLLMLVQFAVLPCESTFFGYYIPNVLQAGVPVVFLFAYLSALKDRRELRIMPSDVFLTGLAIWGFVGLVENNCFDTYYKQYVNKMILPMGFYYITRIIPFDATRIRKLLQANVIVLGVQALLMIRQGTTGHSSIYTTHDGNATGPFVYFWEAAPYLAMWVPLFIRALHNAKSPSGRFLAYTGLGLTVYATTLTQQRGATLALLICVPLCLLSRSMRPTVKTVIALGLLGYIPWSTSNLGEDLLNRFDEKDESRAAYREIGYAILRSPEWNPAFGIGFYQAHRVMRRIDEALIPDEELTLWGRTQRSLESVAREGKETHNFYLSLLIEFGIVGAAFWGGLMVLILVAIYHGYRRARDGIDIDDGLYVSLLASLVAWGGVAYLHNIYRFEATMSMFWFIYALLVAQPGAFVLSE